MKLHDILEGSITDINLARARRDVIKISQQAEQYEQFEQQMAHEYNQLYNYIDDQKEKLRVPGLEDYDNIAGYMFADIGVPTTTLGWREWYDYLPDIDKRKVHMLIYHAPRLIKHIKPLVDALENFEEKWDEQFRKLPTHSAKSEIFDFTYQVKSDLIMTLDGLENLVKYQQLLT